MGAGYPRSGSDETGVLALIEAQFEQLEQRFHQLQAEARQAMQFSSLGGAVTIWAHELNNLITPVLNMSRAALELDDPEYTRKALRVIAGNASTIVAMSERILSLAARKDKLQPHDVDLGRAVRGALESLGRDLTKDRIDGHVDVAPELSAWIDPHVLQQVLFNLLLNAREALMRRGGGRLTVQGFATDESVGLAISDNGEGMDAAQIERLFNPFQSTKCNGTPNSPTVRCSGIGLALCRDLIEESNGAITVHSRSGEGTTFRIVLPKKG